VKHELSRGKLLKDVEEQAGEFGVQFASLPSELSQGQYEAAMVDAR
jgi:hypothetical protein